MAFFWKRENVNAWLLQGYRFESRTGYIKKTFNGNSGMTRDKV